MQVCVVSSTVWSALVVHWGDDVKFFKGSALSNVLPALDGLGMFFDFLTQVIERNSNCPKPHLLYRFSLQRQSSSSCFGETSTK